MEAVCKTKGEHSWRPGPFPGGKADREDDGTRWGRKKGSGRGTGPYRSWEARLNPELGADLQHETSPSRPKADRGAGTVPGTQRTLDKLELPAAQPLTIVVRTSRIKDPAAR